MSEVTVYNVADTIREKVKEFIIQSIPKDQIDGLIKKQWDEFFKDNSDNWNKRPSQFSVMVNKAIEDEIRERIDQAVKDELSRFTQSWSSTGQKVISEAVKQYAPMFIQGLAETATMNLLQAEAQRRGHY